MSDLHLSTYLLEWSTVTRKRLLTRVRVSISSRSSLSLPVLARGSSQNFETVVKVPAVTSSRRGVNL